MLAQLQSRQLFCAYEPWILWFGCKIPPTGPHLDTYFPAGSIIWEPWTCFFPGRSSLSSREVDPWAVIENWQSSFASCSFSFTWLPVQHNQIIHAPVAMPSLAAAMSYSPGWNDTLYLVSKNKPFLRKVLLSGIKSYTRKVANTRGKEQCDRLPSHSCCYGLCLHKRSYHFERKMIAWREKLIFPDLLCSLRIFNL